MEVARGWGRGNQRRWSRGQAPGVRSPGAEWPAWRLQRTVLFIDLKADKDVDLGGAHHRKEADYAAGWRCQRSLPWSLCHTATHRIHALILISVHLTCLYCPMTIAVKLGKKTSILNNGRRAVYTSYLLSCHQPCRYRKQPVRARPATPRARNLDSARVLRGAPRAGRCYPQLRQSPCLAGAAGRLRGEVADDKIPWSGRLPAPRGQSREGAEGDGPRCPILCLSCLDTWCLNPGLTGCPFPQTALFHPACFLIN